MLFASKTKLLWIYISVPLLLLNAPPLPVATSGYCLSRDVIGVGVQVVAAGGAAAEQQLTSSQPRGGSHIISLAAAAAAAAAVAAAAQVQVFVAGRCPLRSRTHRTGHATTTEGAYPSAT